MKSTLTWNTRFPIQIPKSNINLISVISIIVLCTIAFVAINAFADCCEDLEEAVERQRKAVDEAMEAVEDAKAVLDALVEEEAAQHLIDLAEAALSSAAESALTDIGNLMLLLYDLGICQIRCITGSGSCDSGGCD